MQTPSSNSSLLPPIATSKNGIWKKFQQGLSDHMPTAVAGLIAVLISYAGPLLLVLQAAQIANIPHAVMVSWVWAISIGAGLCCIVLSVYYKIPVVCAWNTPGAALLASSLLLFPYSQIIAAYLLASFLMMLLGYLGWFEKIVKLIPASLSAALLAGILVKFGFQIFASVGQKAPYSAGLVLAMLAVYFISKRFTPRYAVLITLVVASFLAFVFGWGQEASHLTVPAFKLYWSWPVFTAPDFSLQALLSVGLPLLLLALTGQQMPGIAVLQTFQYKTPTSQLVGTTGLMSLCLSCFGAHGINLAAITAAICNGPEAHQQASKRWLAAVYCGVFYLLMGSFAATLVLAINLLPITLIQVVAGLALLGAILNGWVLAMQNPHEREAALITFLVTASQQTFLGLGSAFWGVLIGLFAYFVLRPRKVGVN